MSSPYFRPQVVVCFGDSTTALREEITAYPELLQQQWQNRPRPVRVVNAGVRGNHTDHALARFEADVLAHQPDVVVVRFGINDSAIDVWEKPPATTPRVPINKFRANLMTMMDGIRSVGAVPVLCTPNPLAWSEITLKLYGQAPYRPDDIDGFNELLREYVQVIHAVAGELGVPLVDVDGAFRQQVSNEDPPWQSLLLDGMHPNDAGHELAAALLRPVLERILEKLP